MKRFRKWIYGLTTVCVACLGFGTAAQLKSSSMKTANAESSNLVEDGTFDTGDLGYLHETNANWLWWDSDKDGEKDESTLTQAVENGALKLSNTEDGNQFINHGLTLTAGHKYMLYVDIKTENLKVGTSAGEGVWAQVRENGVRASGTVLKKVGYLSDKYQEVGTKGWRTFSMEFTATTTGEHTLGLYFYGSTGTVWFDNIYLAQVDGGAVEYGSSDSYWNENTTVNVASNNELLVPAQAPDAYHNFAAISNVFESNADIKITTDFNATTDSCWGGFIYMYKWNDGADAVAWTYSSQEQNGAEFRFSNVNAWGAQGDWLAIIVSIGDRPAVVSCKNGEMSLVDTMWVNGWSTVDSSSYWKAKTIMDVQLTDTATGVKMAVTYDQLNSDGTQIGLDSYTKTFTIENRALHTKSGVAIKKVDGNALFDGTANNTISVLVDDEASAYVYNPETAEEKQHWVTDGAVSYPTDFNDGSFTLVGIGDPQNFVYNPALYKGMYQWIADHKTAYNIKYAVNLGDTVDQAPDESHWRTAQIAHQILQNANLPYVLTKGNHDYEGYWGLFDTPPVMDRSSEYYDKYFPLSNYTDWLGTENFGSFDEGKMSNTWHKFTNGNDKYLIVSLEYGVKASTVAQAKAFINNNPDYKVIISTHSYLNGNLSYNDDGYINLQHDGAISTQELWDSLISKCSNIFMVLCGHTISNGVSTSVVYGDAGNPIIQMKVDAQGTFDNKETLVALYKIKGTSVETYYYSVSSDRYYAGSNFALDPIEGTKGESGGVVKVDLTDSVSVNKLLGFNALDGVMHTVYGTPTSSDTSVATIDANGNILLKKTGTTTIQYVVSGSFDPANIKGVLTGYTVTLKVSCEHAAGDANKDHKCDTCGQSISACVDTDLDQKCEVCEKWLSDETIYFDNEFGDIDVGHVGGGIENEHVYDQQVATQEYLKYKADCTSHAAYYYSCVCGKKGEATFAAGELGPCADEGKDHRCDVCGKELTVCVDSNGDCNCDICGIKIPVTFTFKAANISIKDTIHIQYAVDMQGLTEAQKKNVRVLIWTTPQSEYVYGTHAAELSASMTATINYIKYPVFAFTDLSVRRMTEDVYACVYLDDGADGYYSEPLKYSILEYAYAKLGKTDRAPARDPKLIAVLNDMLALGEAMQIYQGHNLDRLPTDEYIYVKIDNAVFDDGVSTGLYKAGTQLTVRAKDNYIDVSDLPGYFTRKGDKITFTVPDVVTVDSTSFIYFAHGDSPMNDLPAEVILTTPQTYEHDNDYVQAAITNVNENYVSVTMEHTTSEFYGININLTGSTSVSGWSGGVILSYTQNGLNLRLNSIGSSGVNLALLEIPEGFAENKAGTLVYKWTALMDEDVCYGLQLDVWYGVDGVYTKAGLLETRTNDGRWHYEEATKSFVFNYDIVSPSMLAPDCTIVSLFAQNAYHGAASDWILHNVSVWANKPSGDFDNDNNEFVGNDGDMNWDSWGN